MNGNSDLINLIKKNLILSFQLFHLQTLLFEPFNNSLLLPFVPIPDSPHAYLVHPCSPALITRYRNSILQFCLHLSLSIVSLGRLGLLVGGDVLVRRAQCWPLKEAVVNSARNVWLGGSWAPPCGEQEWAYLPDLVLPTTTSTTPSVDFHKDETKTNETPDGQACWALGEERLCKSKPFFYWGNKANDSKLSSLYPACTSQSRGWKLHLEAIEMNHYAITIRLWGNSDSGMQCSRLMMRWMCPLA